MCTPSGPRRNGATDVTAVCALAAPEAALHWSWVMPPQLGGGFPAGVPAYGNAFYLFIEVFLPYFVFSRCLDDVAKIRDAMAALVVSLPKLCEPESGSKPFLPRVTAPFATMSATTSNSEARR